MKKENKKASVQARALRLLTLKERSTDELRQKLLKEGYLAEEVEETLTWLQGLNYLDDRRFAENFVESQNRFRPQGSLMLQAELRKRGIDDAIIQEVVNSPDKDYELAYQLACARLKQMEHLEPEKRWRRIGGLLARRGFSWDIVRRVLRELFSTSLDMEI